MCGWARPSPSATPTPISVWATARRQVGRHTDLQAASNKTYKRDVGTYPQRSGTTAVTFQSAFASGDANYALAGVHGLQHKRRHGENLNGKVAANGTKAAGGLDRSAQITIS